MGREFSVILECPPVRIDVQLEEDTARKLAMMLGRFDTTIGRAMDLIMANMTYADMADIWQQDTGRKSLLSWMLSGDSKWTVDDFAEILNEKEYALEQVEACASALADSDNWDDWNYDGHVVFGTKDDYIRRYEFDLRENESIIRRTFEEIEEVRREYEEGTDYQHDPQEWGEELAKFAQWYNTYYRPQTPVTL